MSQTMIYNEFVKDWFQKYEKMCEWFPDNQMYYVEFYRELSLTVTWEIVEANPENLGITVG